MRERQATRLLLEVCGRVHRWRWLTGGRRAELILLLDDLLAEIQRVGVDSE